MTTVTWEHNILAAARYSGTSRRIARMIAGGAIFPPPIRFGSWSGDSDWTPTTDVRGRAPRDYSPPFADTLLEFYDNRTYVFAFWSVSGSSPTGTPFFEVYNERTPSPGGGPWTLDAKAWYVWNYAGGGGEHAVEVDAFSRTDNRFISDFFVDVLPDGPPDPSDPTAGGPLSRIANYDGYVATGTLTKPVQIRAREIIGDGTERYRFVRWAEVESLTSGEPMPFVDDDRIIVHPGNIMRAVAIYNRLPPTPPPPIRPVVVLPEGGYIIGIPAGQPYILFPWSGGGPIPVGGDDPPILKQILERLDRMEIELRGLIQK